MFAFHLVIVTVIAECVTSAFNRKIWKLAGIVSSFQNMFYVVQCLKHIGCSDHLVIQVDNNWIHFLLQEWDQLSEQQREIEDKLQELEASPPRFVFV